MTPMMREAISRDSRGQYSEAIKHYELELNKNKNASVDTYLNLGFIYWELSTQPPFCFDEGVSDRWSLIAGERYEIVIEQGLAKYPQNFELHFWERYSSHIILGNEFTQEDCEKLLEEYGDSESIVPYFFLYLFDKVKYKEKRNQLLKQCLQLPTAKNLYIKAIIGR